MQTRGMSLGLACSLSSGGSGDSYDVDASSFFADEPGATRKTEINAYTVGMNTIFGRGNWAVWMTELGLTSAGATVHKLGSTAWGGPGTFGGAPLPTVGASGTPLVTADGHFLALGNWGAPFAGGIYYFTLAAPVSVTVGARSRGISMEGTAGNPRGGLWIAFDNLMYADTIGSGSGRVSGSSGATAGVPALFAGSSSGRCWRDTTLVASGGGTDSLGATIIQAEVGRSGTSVTSAQTHYISGAVAAAGVGDAQHNSHYALLRATLFPWLPVLALAAIYNAYIWEDGNGVEFALDKPLHSVSKDGLTVKADGVPIPIHSVTPSRNPSGGTTWEARFYKQWITAGQAVTISYTGNQFKHVTNFAVPGANNDSETTTRAVAAFAERTWLSNHFNTATFTIAGGLSGQLAPGDSALSLFNPSGLTGPGSLDNWNLPAQAIDATGCMLTVKHVDGYCLWESTVSAARCVSASEPWWSTNGFDIVAAFCNRTRAAGRKVGFYFSVLDRRFRLDHPEWVWANYQPGGSIADPGIPYIPAASAAYTAYIQAQLTELLDGRYGVIDQILFDAWQITGNEEYPSYVAVNVESTIALVRSLQPGIMILVNDYTQGQGVVSEIAMYEWGTAQPVPRDVNRHVALTWMCPTLPADNNGWFDDPARRDDYDTPANHAGNVALTRERQGYLLFNISPDVTGLYDAFQLAYMDEVGAAIT